MPSAGPRVPPLSSTLCRQRQACESPSLARRSPRQQEGDHTHALALKWNARSTAPYEHEMRLCGGNHPCVDCGAVLIASDVAITAAHCFNWKPMTWSNAYYGAPNTASGSGWWLKVSAYNLRGKFPACPPEPPPRPAPAPAPAPARPLLPARLCAHQPSTLPAQNMTRTACPEHTTTTATGGSRWKLSLATSTTSRRQVSRPSRPRRQCPVRADPFPPSPRPPQTRMTSRCCFSSARPPVPRDRS